VRHLNPVLDDPNSTAAMKSSLTDDRIVVFDRTPVARLFSCAAAFGSAALLFDYLSRGAAEIEALPLMALVGLVAGTVIAALIQYGDHIYMSSSGVLYENRFLPFLGKRGRWLRWEDVVEVREIRRKVLVILSRDGRRVLVDAIFGYAIARNEIVRHASHAVFSGTLARDDQT
jgi:hypothetical protein